MGALCERLSARCILLDPPAKDKDGVIRCLIEALAKCRTIQDPEKLLGEVLERERLISTCVGKGCAMQHANSGTVDTTALAVARLDPAQDYGAPDGIPVSLVILMVGPMTNVGLHLKLLSKLARLLHDDSFRTELLAAGMPSAFHDLVCRKEG